MENKVVYKLKGHEKFPLRDGWITKGIKGVIENGMTIFRNGEGPDILGVGTNMVKSIRYWMQACGILEKVNNKDELSEIAKIIYEYDRNFEDVFSIWLLHSNLAKNKEAATIWYMFFNRFEADEFSKADLQEHMKTEMFNLVGKHVTESSVKDDIDVLLNMYSKKDNRGEDPEDKSISPLAMLGLIEKDGDTYIRMQPSLEKLDRMIILYELSCMFKYEKALSIDRICTGENGLEKIYNLSRVAVNKYLDELETIEAIRVDRTAGLDMVYPMNMENPIEIIKAYYR